MVVTLEYNIRFIADLTDVCIWCDEGEGAVFEESRDQYSHLANGEWEAAILHL